MKTKSKHDSDLIEKIFSAMSTFGGHLVSKIKKAGAQDIDWGTTERFDYFCISVYSTKKGSDKSFNIQVEDRNHFLITFYFGTDYSKITSIAFHPDKFNTSIHALKKLVIFLNDDVIDFSKSEQRSAFVEEFNQLVKY